MEFQSLVELAELFTDSGSTMIFNHMTEVFLLKLGRRQFVFRSQQVIFAHNAKKKQTNSSMAPRNFQMLLLKLPRLKTLSHVPAVFNDLSRVAVKI